MPERRAAASSTPPQRLAIASRNCRAGRARYSAPTTAPAISSPATNVARIVRPTYTRATTGSLRAPTAPCRSRRRRPRLRGPGRTRRRHDRWGTTGRGSDRSTWSAGCSISAAPPLRSARQRAPARTPAVRHGPSLRAPELEAKTDGPCRRASPLADSGRSLRSHPGRAFGSGPACAAGRTTRRAGWRAGATRTRAPGTGHP